MAHFIMCVGVDIGSFKILWPETIALLGLDITGGPHLQMQLYTNQIKT